jgi:hypothetical protein
MSMRSRTYEFRGAKLFVTYRPRPPAHSTRSR